MGLAVVVKQRLQPGDAARVRLAGDSEWSRAWVALASDTNPSSVALLLESPVRTSGGGLIMNMLPISINYDTGTVASLFSDEYEIEVAGRE